MKKLVFSLLLVAVCFFSVVAQKYSAEETAAANLWRLSKPLNNLQDENVIYPGNVLIFAYPQKEDRWMAPIQKGDWALKISKQLVQGKFVIGPVNPDPVVEFKPQKEIVPVLPVVDQKSYLGLCYGLLFLLVLTLFVLLGLLLNLTEAKKQHKKEIEQLKEEGLLLAKELEKTKNMLPVNPPPMVDEEWLKNNYSVSDFDYSHRPDIAPGMFNRIYGKMPDLVVQALVSTDEKATKMDFSYQRKAITGLKDVSIWLGWDWNSEKQEWNEVGMIASVCCNGFQVSPEKIVPMANLFTKIELVSSDRHPVVYKANLLPKKNFKYPTLIHGLIMKYHAENIVDINRAGAVIVPKTTNEEKK